MLGYRLKPGGTLRQNDVIQLYVSTGKLSMIKIEFYFSLIACVMITKVYFTKQISVDILATCN